MILWRLNIVLRCVVWFICNMQQIHMIFQSCLVLMPLSTASYLRCLLAAVWEVDGFTLPYVSSLFSWRVVYLSRSSFSCAAPTWFAIRLIFCVLFWISHFGFFCVMPWRFSSVLKFCLHHFPLIFFFWLFFVLVITTVLLLLLLLHRYIQVFKAMEFLTNIFGLLQGLFFNKILELASIRGGLLVKYWSVCLQYLLWLTFQWSIFVGIAGSDYLSLVWYKGPRLQRRRIQRRV